MWFVLLILLFLIFDFCVLVLSKRWVKISKCDREGLHSKKHTIEIINLSGNETVAVCSRCFTRWKVDEIDEYLLSKRDKKKW